MLELFGVCCDEQWTLCPNEQIRANHGRSIPNVNLEGTRKETFGDLAVDSTQCFGES